MKKTKKHKLSLSTETLRYVRGAEGWGTSGTCPTYSLAVCPPPTSAQACPDSVVCPTMFNYCTSISKWFFC